MALRDWHGWQIGIVWGFGIALAWLVSRLGVTAAVVPKAAEGGVPEVSAGGAPLWTTGVTLVIVTILIIVTIRWVRGRILDE
jgi:hypothetical protein